jgi:hypothetical protein
MAADRDSFARESARLLAQAELFSSDGFLMEEAVRWRDVTPERRLAETWRLCSLVPQLRKNWPPDVQRRAAEPSPLPSDVVALLERMKQTGSGSSR